MPTVNPLSYRLLFVVLCVISLHVSMCGPMPFQHVAGETVFCGIRSLSRVCRPCPYVLAIRPILSLYHEYVWSAQWDVLARGRDPENSHDRREASDQLRLHVAPPYTSGAGL